MDDKERGVHATSKEFARYDQVDKPQEYHLAESADEGAFDEAYEIKVCDLGRFLHGGEEAKRSFCRELGDALRDIGFAILDNTGIDPELYDRAAAHVVDFFTTTPLEKKLAYRSQRHGSVNQGYFPIKETSDIHPDLVEGWVFCRRAFAFDAQRPVRLEEFWPRPEMEPFFRGLCLEHERLIIPVMQAILTALGEDPHLYDRKLTGTNFGLRLNYYPPIGSEDDAMGAGRLLGHEDVDMFTLLPAPQIEGLQVLNRRSGKWVRLKAPRGSIVLNTGDYMQRITNDILPSTTHRVSKPRDPALRAVPRASFPMAVYLWEDELLEGLPSLPAKYPPIKAISFHTKTTSKFYGDNYAVDK
jgi:isopenicillin N synthase-like dioxygenase